MLLFLLAACGRPELDSTAIPSPIASPPLTGDSSEYDYDVCVLVGTAVAFLDSNENGAFDEGEFPLPNILFHLTPSDGSQSHAVTNAAGEADLSGAMASCENGRIFAEPPPGLRLTTPATVTITSAIDPHYFGFVYIPGEPTRTPRPAAEMVCETFTNRFQGDVVTRILKDASGHVWLASLGRLSEYLPETGEWVDHRVGEGFGLSILEDGRIAGGAGDIDLYDGSTWHSMDWSHGYIYGIVSAENGDLWILDEDGLSRLEENGSLIESFTFTVGIPDAASLAITADQNLWITGLPDSALYSLLLSGREKGDWNFIRYDLSDLPVPPDNSIQNVIAAPDGSLWFTTGGWLKPGGQALKFNPQLGSWITYSAASTEGALAVNSITSVYTAEDGSVWLASARDGIAHLFPNVTDRSSDVRVDLFLPAEFHGNYLTSIGMEKDGVIWAGAMDAAYRCVVVEP